MLPIRGRARVVIVALIVLAAISLANAVVDWKMIGILQELGAGQEMAPARKSAALTTATWGDALFIGDGVTFLVAGVAFLCWFHRAHRNLSLAGIKRLLYSPGWAVGGFLVPVLSLVRPFQVMHEVWYHSARLDGAMTDHTEVAAGSGGLVRAWWGFYLLWQVTSDVTLRTVVGRQRPPSGFKVALCHDLLGALGIALAMILVHRITTWQEQARRSMNTPGVRGAF